MKTLCVICFSCHGQKCREWQFAVSEKVACCNWFLFIFVLFWTSGQDQWLPVVSAGFLAAASHWQISHLHRFWQVCYFKLWAPPATGHHAKLKLISARLLFDIYHTNNTVVSSVASNSQQESNLVYFPNNQTTPSHHFVKLCIISLMQHLVELASFFKGPVCTNYKTISVFWCLIVRTQRWYILSNNIRTDFWLSKSQ